MTDQHTTSVISVTLAWTASGQLFGYRARCSCGWKGRKFPMDQRAVAEAQAEQHAEYHRDVARITGQGEGR